MLTKKIAFSFFLIGIILSGILTSVFSMGPADLLQRVEAQTKSKSQSQAQAAIKKSYNALAAAGMTGTPGPLLSTGEGFAKFYRGPNGTNAFVIFWKPSTGAHAVIGPIMTTYGSKGWHFGDLGYPTSDEKDLAGVTDGRYNQFEHGVIAVVKGKGALAQAFPTVQAAVDKLKGAAPQAQAAAAIKKAYDALAAAGMTGTPGPLLNTGNGFAQFYRGPNGTNAFVIFWKPSTGAHAVIGPIMTTYKSEGWHLGDLGYPTSDEKDLAGVTDGRYNQFEHGVIAVVKGKGALAQAFPTVQAAVDKLKQGVKTGPIIGIPTTQVPVPAKAPPIEKYRVNVLFDQVTVHNDHEGALSGDGEYELKAYVHGILVDLTKLSTCRDAGLTDVSSGETVKFCPGNSMPFNLNSTIPLIILTFGTEDDGCSGPVFPANIQPVIFSALANESAKAFGAANGTKGGSGGGSGGGSSTLRGAGAAAGAAVGTAYGGPVGGAIGAAVGDQVGKYVGKGASWAACKANPDDKIGSIEESYIFPNYGTGPHTVQSDAKDYTLTYTISAQKIG